VLDDPLEFRIRAGENIGGHMAEITAIDASNGILTISPPIDGALGMDASDPVRHTRVQRWDQQNDVDSNGLIDTMSGLYELEDGVQVAFSIDSSNPLGGFKRGDYWLITARTADGSVEKLEAAPPRGVHHHYCRLAVVHWRDSVATSWVHDCRTLWPPAQCCTISVRPGEDIQAAIDRLPAEGGCVCLLSGVHHIHEPLLIDGRENILFKGMGPASKLIYRPLDPKQPHYAAIYVVGGSRDICVAGMLIHAEDLPHLVVLDEDVQSIEVADCRLINASEDKSADCVLLGECCDVRLQGNRMLAVKDIAQARAQQLVDIVDELTTLRPPAEGEGMGEGAAAEAVAPPVPRRIQPLQQLWVTGNSLYFTSIGVFLADALHGAVSDNRLQGLAKEFLQAFQRKARPQPPRNLRDISAEEIRREEVRVEAAEGMEVDVRPFGHAETFEAYREAGGGDADAFYNELDDRLLQLPPCAELAEQAATDESGEVGGHLEPFDSNSQGVVAALIQDYEIRHNQMVMGIGMKLLAGRDVSTRDNCLLVETAGVLLGYAFDTEVCDSRIELTASESKLDEMPSDPRKAWRRRLEPGRAAMSLFFVRGLKVNNNRFHADTGIAADRTAKGAVNSEELTRDSVLRLFGIQRLWKVTVELAWFFYQLFALLSEAEETPPPEGTSRKELFEQQMFKAFAEFLSGRYFSHFIGKAEIADNRMQVGRYGVLLHDMLSIGGLRVLRNRISGHAWGGIHVHPWYSVGRVGDFAKWLRCAMQWLLAILTLFRDWLSAYLDGSSDEEVGDNGLLGLVTVGISWVLLLCSRYCGGSTTPGGGSGDGETPPSPVEVLKEALDEFLDGMDPAWIDDLANQAYVIDGNVLAGAGDGIYTGLDGSVVSNNTVTVWPHTQVPYEMVLFGVRLEQHFSDRELDYYPAEMAILAEGAAEADRDSLFIGAANVFGWVDTYWDAVEFRADLRSLVGDWAGMVSSSSPLAPHAQAMWQGLDEANLQQAMVSAAWQSTLLIMVWELKGYGILLMGANMDCHNNKVEANTGCGSRSRGNLLWGTDNLDTNTGAAGRNNPAIAVRKPRPIILFSTPGLGGIWQTSNLSSLFTDMLLLLGEEKKYSVYDLILVLLAYLLLSLNKELSLRISHNQVERVLLHGIRSLNIHGSDETEIAGNQVRNASRYGICHCTAPFVDLQGRVTLKVQRNSVLQAQNSSVFSSIGGLPQHFSALMWLMNGEIESTNQSSYGTTLLANNHGDGRVPQGDNSAAIHVNSQVVAASDNHVLCAANYAFSILANQGLFTDNLTNRTNDLPYTGFDQGPNVQI
jgi:hypothetical protein